jgi:hypothetical protein
MTEFTASNTDPAFQGLRFGKGQKQVEFPDQKAKGDYGNGGADPGQEGPFIRGMVSKVSDHQIASARSHENCMIEYSSAKRHAFTLWVYSVDIPLQSYPNHTGEEQLAQFEINYLDERGGLLEKLCAECRSEREAKVLAHAMKAKKFSSFEVWHDEALIYQRPLPTGK